MNNKTFSIIFITSLLVGIITIFSARVFADGTDFLCSFQGNNYTLAITLKDNTDIEVSKTEILKISDIKIKKIVYKDKEWSKFVNKYDDLPNMENPFKNEIWIKVNKKANLKEIYEEINKLSFVEGISGATDKSCTTKQ